MPLNWTPEQIPALAPDARVAKAGKCLAGSRKRLPLGCDDQAAWGECQGSAASAYQASVDLTGPAGPPLGAWADGRFYATPRGEG